MTLPNFLLIGAAKAGTSSVFAYLGQHPDVFISPTKEPNFFALAGQDVHFAGPGDSIVNRVSITRLDTYEALFKSARTGMAVGEASTLYLYNPGTAEAIRRLIPDARVLAILRDPAERAYSSYLHMRRDGREPMARFEDALHEEEARVHNHWEHLWHYSRLGFYYAQLKRYHECFPREQIGVWLYEDLEREPHRVLREVFAFLGVDPAFMPDMSLRHKVAGTPRSKALHAILTRPNGVKSLTKQLLPSGVRARLYGTLMRKNIVVQRNKLQPEVRRRLQALYRSDVESLAGLLGRDLSAWLDEREDACP